MTKILLITNNSGSWYNGLSDNSEKHAILKLNNYSFGNKLDLLFSFLK